MAIWYQDWIYLTTDERAWDTNCSPAERLRREQLAEAVRAAVAELKPAEREVIERYHFEGRTFSEIAAELGCRTNYIRNLHRQGSRKLRKLLAPFVRNRFRIAAQPTNCPICASGHRREAEALIARHHSRQPYAELIGRLRNELGITISSPRTIIGHVAYHI